MVVEGIHYSIIASEEAITDAEERGFIVVRRSEQSLLVDLDGMSVEEFEQRVRTCRTALSIRAWRYWESKTPGHYHAEVLLSKSMSNAQAVAAQSILGSDYRRELAALNDLRVGNPNWSVLFRPASATVQDRG